MTHCAFFSFFLEIKSNKQKFMKKSGPTFHIVNHIFAKNTKKNLDIQKNKN